MLCDIDWLTRICLFYFYFRSALVAHKQLLFMESIQSNMPLTRLLQQYSMHYILQKQNTNAIQFKNTTPLLTHTYKNPNTHPWVHIHKT